MKLSEHDTPNRLREIARTYLKNSQHYALEEAGVMADKWEQAESENAALKRANEALREYATHIPGCYENSKLCICGLDALLTSRGVDDETER